MPGTGVNPSSKRNTGLTEAACQRGDSRRRFALQGLGVQASLTGNDEIGSGDEAYLYRKYVKYSRPEADPSLMLLPTGKSLELS